jgi:hypothetical protein
MTGIYYFKSGDYNFNCYAIAEAEAWVKLSKALPGNTAGWKIWKVDHVKNYSSGVFKYADADQINTVATR